MQSAECRIDSVILSEQSESKDPVECRMQSCVILSERSESKDLIKCGMRNAKREMKDECGMRSAK